MQPEEAVARLGGVTTRAAILELIPARRLTRAVEEGRIVRDGRGRYSSASVGEGIQAANAVAGALSHLSAAQQLGVGGEESATQAGGDRSPEAEGAS